MMGVVQEVALEYTGFGRVLPHPRFWTDDGELLLPTQWFTQGVWELMSTRTYADSTPGLPAVALGMKTAGDFLEKTKPDLGRQVWTRLRDRIDFFKDQVEDLAVKAGGKLAAGEYMRMGLRDLVRLFIKAEPHTLSKAELKRWRLIMNTSIVDIAVSRVAAQPLIDHEISHWADSYFPSAPGMGLDDKSIDLLRKGMEVVRSEMSADVGQELEWKSSDAKHWDWCYTLLVALGCAEVERLQYGVAYDSELAVALRADAVLTAHKVYVDSSGEMWEDQEAGKQESGSLWTACRNSKGRKIVSKYRGSLFCKAMGDDAMELWLNNEPKHEDDGFIIEYPDLPANVEFEFCSHWFMKGGPAVPLNWAKSFYRLLGHKPDPGLRSQFEYEMRNSPELPRLRAWLDEHWPVLGG